MAAKSNRVVLPGSERKPVPGAKPRAAADPERLIEVTVRLRSREPRAQQLMEMGAQLPANRKYLSREDFSRVHGADPADVAKIDAFAHQHHLTVLRTSLPQRVVKLTGKVEDFNAAFGVKLRTFQARGKNYRGRTGPIYVPKELKNVIRGVHGLDNRPVATPHFRMRPSATGAASPKNAADGSFAVTEVAELYNFPSNLTGKG